MPKLRCSIPKLSFSKLRGSMSKLRQSNSKLSLIMSICLNEICHSEDVVCLGQEEISQIKYVKVKSST